MTTTTKSPTNTTTSINPVAGTKTSKKSNKYVIITPAVTIDRSCDVVNSDSNDQYHHQHAIENYDFPQELQSTVFNRNLANSEIQRSTTKLLPKRSPVGSWRWCTLICAAVKCFGNNGSLHRATTVTATGNNCVTPSTSTVDTAISNVTLSNQDDSQTSPLGTNENTSYSDGLCGVLLSSHDKNQNVIYEL